MKETKQELIDAAQIVTLKRNPQYLTPAQMESLKISIQRDGFVVPILVRQLKGKRYEIVSGNHRFMAARELKIEKIPCVVTRVDARSAGRLAVNLNTIHGEPNAELLAPFLAEMDKETLAQIHLGQQMIDELVRFDSDLEARLAKMQLPESINRKSPQHSNATCVCAKCGATHVKKKSTNL